MYAAILKRPVVAGAARRVVHYLYSPYQTLSAGKQANKAVRRIPGTE
jgi:hypothetical protein